jgi:ATP-dependent helicase/nuclease subunit A
VEAEVPRRCAFVYSEAACPPSLQSLLEAEVTARRREELNGLYVAMTRAKQRLVFSATEPSRRLPIPSWWDRVVPLAEPWTIEHVASPVSSATPGGLSAVPPARLLALPTLQRADRRPRREPVAVDARQGVAKGYDTDATRLGKAVHRVLEWTTGAAPDSDAGIQTLAAAAAREFGASTEATAHLAGTILQNPDCARFFFGDALRWAGNEVPVGNAGAALRIDRLVRLQSGGSDVWWVLDYKLQHAPGDVPEYREQLLRYRAAVQEAQPNDQVRCAFITGAGNVVEIS